MIDSGENARPTSHRSHYLLELVVVVVLTAALLAIMSARDAIDTGVAPKVFLLLRMAGLVLLCTWFLKRNGERWVDLGLRRPRRWWIVPLLVVAGFVLLVVLSTLLFRLLFPALGIEPPQSTPTPLMSEDPAEYLFWAVAVAWGSAAFGEELLARGFILDRLAKVIGGVRSPAFLAAVFLQAAVFGAFHVYQGFGGAIITAVAGLVLGLMWICGGRNLWAPILMHGIVDFLAANGL